MLPEELPTDPGAREKERERMHGETIETLRMADIMYTNGLLPTDEYMKIFFTHFYWHVLRLHCGGGAEFAAVAHGARDEVYEKVKGLIAETILEITGREIE